MNNEDPTAPDASEEILMQTAAQEAAQEGYELEAEYIRALRDEFAAHALAGLLSNSSYARPLISNVDGMKTLGQQCYAYADALLEERQRRYG